MYKWFSSLVCMYSLYVFIYMGQLCLLYAYKRSCMLKCQWFTLVLFCYMAGRFLVSGLPERNCSPERLLGVGASCGWQFFPCIAVVVHSLAVA